MQHFFKLSLLALAITSTTILAQDPPHGIGVQLDFSVIDTQDNNNTHGLNDVTRAHYTLSYQYNINEYFAVGAGCLNGDSDSFIRIVDIFTDSELECNAFMNSIKAQ